MFIFLTEPILMSDVPKLKARCYNEFPLFGNILFSIKKLIKAQSLLVVTRE